MKRLLRHLPLALALCGFASHAQRSPGVPAGDAQAAPEAGAPSTETTGPGAVAPGPGDDTSAATGGGVVIGRPQSVGRPMAIGSPQVVGTPQSIGGGQAGTPGAPTRESSAIGGAGEQSLPTSGNMAGLAPDRTGTDGDEAPRATSDDGLTPSDRDEARLPTRDSPLESSDATDAYAPASAPPGLEAGASGGSAPDTGGSGVPLTDPRRSRVGDADVGEALPLDTTGGGGNAGAQAPGLILGPTDPMTGAMLPPSAEGAAGAQAPGAQAPAAAPSTPSEGPLLQLDSSLQQLEATGERSEALQTQQLQTLEDMAAADAQDRDAAEAYEQSVTNAQSETGEASAALREADLALRSGETDLGPVLAPARSSVVAAGLEARARGSVQRENELGQALLWLDRAQQMAANRDQFEARRNLLEAEAVLQGAPLEVSPLP